LSAMPRCRERLMSSSEVALGWSRPVQLTVALLFLSVVSFELYGVLLHRISDGLAYGIWMLAVSLLAMSFMLIFWIMTSPPRRDISGERP
jgi:drug/metabolite transporter (DMT)-like permease